MTVRVVDRPPRGINICVRVRAAVQQQLRNVAPPGQRCEPQRTAPARRRLLQLHQRGPLVPIGSQVQQQPHNVEVPMLHRQGEQPARPPIDLPQHARIGQSHFADTIGVRQPHSRADRHFCAMIQQPPRNGGKIPRAPIVRLAAGIGRQRRAVNRRQAIQILLAHVGPLAQQPRHHLLVGRSRGGVQRRRAVAVAGADQRLVRLQQPHRFAVVAAAYGAVDLVLHRRDRSVGATHRLPPVLLLFLDRGHDVPIPAVPRQSEGGCRIAVRENALARIGASRHQQAHHRRVAAEHRVVQGLMLVVAGHVHCGQLGAGTQQRPRRGDVAHLDGLRQPCHTRSVHECFQLGPTLVAVRSRQHPLRVVEGGGRIAGAQLLQQILGLFAQLLPTRLPRQMAQWMGISGSGHDDLLFSLPGVRVTGAKKIRPEATPTPMIGGLSPSRGHGGARRAQSASYHARGAASQLGCSLGRDSQRVP